ncbi:MAG: cation:proton antiporter [Clostridia bacterium]|nr:cation:proton antiporter [Clostridia bacterium]
MLDKLYGALGGATSVSAVIISVAIMLLAGFLMTRLTKLVKLPSVTAYILAGILIGPYVLNLVPGEVVKGMDFISDVALAFVAFGVGEFFRFSTIKRNGAKVVVITLFEALLASLAVFVLTYFILGLGFPFSLILSALASATAPASTMMIIRQTKAKGDFVDTLLSVVALDNVVSLVAFSVTVSIGLAAINGTFSAKDALLPIGRNALVIAVGILFGFLLKLLMARRSTDNRLIVSVALLFALCGIGAALDVSPLLGCMAMGTVYINASDDERLFKQLNYFNPPVLLLFFVVSGMNFRLNALFNSEGALNGIPVAVIGLLYFAVRIAGKYGGAFLGCLTTGKSGRVRNCMGLALIPQAGVAIGLAALGARILGGEAGVLLQTIILASSVLYELIGPASAKLSLYLSGSYGKESAERVLTSPEKPDDVELLKEKLYNIQKEIADREYARTDEESAYIDAIEEQDDTMDYIRKKFINRR